MPRLPFPKSQLDAGQTAQYAFNEETGKYRVEAEITAQIGEVTIESSAADGDNIAISDGVNTLEINPDGSLNATITNAIDVDISHTTDSIKLGDGTNLVTTSASASKRGLDVNVLNNIDISGSVDALFVGVNEYTFNEISVAAGATLTIISQLFPTDYKLRKVKGSGENIGVFSLKFSGAGVDKYRTTYTDFNYLLDYETGIFIPAGTTVTVEATNVSNSPALYSTQILYSAK